MAKEKKVIDVTPSELQVRSNSPADLTREFLAKGGTVEQLREILALQKEHEAYEALKAFNKDMAAFKSEPIEILKDKTVAYDKVKYSHASLHNVVEKITAALSKHGLSVSWRTSQADKISVTTRISHVLGHFEETTLSAPADSTGSKNGIQAIGSTVTYLQRYGLLAITGLATKEQDDDGKATSEETITEQQLVTVNEWLTKLEGKVDLKRFLAHFKIETVEALPKSKFTEAIQLFKKRSEAN